MFERVCHDSHRALSPQASHKSMAGRYNQQHKKVKDRSTCGRETAILTISNRRQSITNNDASISKQINAVA